MSEHIVEASDATFKAEVLDAALPVLVDFWAPWCVPCLAVAPILEELAKEYSDRLKVVKVNVDTNNKTAAIYQIRGIPTMILFRNGEIQEQIVGGVLKPDLQEFLDRLL